MKRNFVILRCAISLLCFRSALQADVADVTEGQVQTCSFNYLSNLGVLREVIRRDEFDEQPYLNSINEFTSGLTEFAWRLSSGKFIELGVEGRKQAALNDLAYLFPNGTDAWKYNEVPLNLRFHQCRERWLLIIRYALSERVLDEIADPRMRILNDYMRAFINECWFSYAGDGGHFSGEMVIGGPLVARLNRFMDQLDNSYALSKVESVLYIAAEAEFYRRDNQSRQQLNPQLWREKFNVFLDRIDLTRLSAAFTTNAIKKVLTGTETSQVSLEQFDNELYEPCQDLRGSISCCWDWEIWEPGYAGMLPNRAAYNPLVRSRLHILRTCMSLLNTIEAWDAELFGSYMHERPR